MEYEPRQHEHVGVDLRKEGLIDADLDTTYWNSLMSKDELYTEHWLLAYEASSRGWLHGSGTDYIATANFFETLRGLDVSFYDTGAATDPVDLLPPRDVSGIRGLGDEAEQSTDSL